MKIKMLTISASPNGVMQVGKVYEVSAVVGRSLIAGGFALELPPVVKVPARGETAIRETPEKAVLPPRGKKLR